MSKGTRAHTHHEPPPMQPVGPAARLFYLLFGWLNVGVGLIGIVVPGLPTTVFFIVAVWAFSRSSERFQRWLWAHPRLARIRFNPGRILRQRRSSRIRWA